MTRTVATKTTEARKNKFVWRVGNIPELYLNNKCNPTILTVKNSLPVVVVPAWLTDNGSFGLTMIFTDKIEVHCKEPTYYLHEVYEALNWPTSTSTKS